MERAAVAAGVELGVGLLRPLVGLDLEDLDECVEPVVLLGDRLERALDEIERSDVPRLEKFVGGADRAVEIGR